MREREDASPTLLDDAATADALFDSGNLFALDDEEAGVDEEAEEFAEAAPGAESEGGCALTVLDRFALSGASA